MPSKNLLNINPDILFQEHTIAEIDDTQKKLLLEIERKREELRVMVGERYRDLIEAADTIEEMGSTVHSCIKHLDSMTVTCKNLHDTHLLGFKNDASLNIPRPIANKQIHGLAVQIKILMSIPEQIWSHVDVEDYLTASQLFIFARHIYTGLQLEIGGSSGNKKMMPVVQQQWNSLSTFNTLLINSCKTQLGNPDIKANVAASCLTSLFLLDNKLCLTDLMNTFIVLHSTDSLSKILMASVEDNIKQGNIKDDIKQRITTSVKVILRTIELFHCCFVEGGKGLILQILNSLFQKNAPPLINLVKLDDTISVKLLPPVVAEYRLSSPMELTSASQDELSNYMNTWMKWVQTFAAEQVDKLFKYVKSTKSLHQIREDALQIETPKNWDEICKALSIDQSHSNIWTAHFQPLMTARVKELISNKWTDIRKNLMEAVNKSLSKVTLPGCREKESNLNWYVWNDLIGQTYVDSKEDIIKSINTLMKGMTMQDRGFTPNLENLCELFNTNLNNLLDDLKIYLYGSQSNETDNENLNKLHTLYESDVKHLLLETSDTLDQTKIAKYLDRNEIEDFLRQSSKTNLKLIIDFIQNDCVAKKETEYTKKTSAILTARFLQALPQLVPNLRLCFIPPPVHIPGSVFEDVHTKDLAAANDWDELCKTLNISCNACWETWIDISIKRVDVLLKDMPQEFTTLANMDYLLVQWDHITIEEKDDQDQPINSTIKIPAGPSIKLQKYLYAVCRILDEVIPHTLTKKIHTIFIESVASKTLQYFLSVIKEKWDQINQKCALQLLMDVRHLTLLMITRENKKGLTDSHEICDLLKQKIDPFDYDVFYPLLQINIKRSVQRVQTLFGSIVANHDQLTSIIGVKPLLSGGTADKEPNTYILTGQSNANTSWFPLLPISAPVNRRSEEKQRKKQIPAQQKIVNTTSEQVTVSPASNTSNIVRSGAAAFFGSMTSDWFGS